MDDYPTKAMVPMRTDWPQQLPMEVALDIYPIEEILERAGMTMEEYATLCTSKAFQMALADAREAAMSPDTRFQAKSAAIAEDLLPDLYNAVKGEDTSPQQKLAIMSKLVEWSGLRAREPAPTAGNLPGSGGVVINIRMADGTSAASARAIGGTTYDAD